MFSWLIFHHCKCTTITTLSLQLPLNSLQLRCLHCWDTTTTTIMLFTLHYWIHPAAPPEKKKKKTRKLWYRYYTTTHLRQWTCYYVHDYVMPWIFARDFALEAVFHSHLLLFRLPLSLKLLLSLVSCGHQCACASYFWLTVIFIWVDVEVRLCCVHYERFIFFSMLEWNRSAKREWIFSDSCTALELPNAVRYILHICVVSGLETRVVLG